MPKSSPYKPGNKFAHYISFSDAAVKLAGISDEEYQFIRITEDGMPIHVEDRSLARISYMLSDIVAKKEIKGHTHNENNQMLHKSRILLSRKSLNDWTEEYASI
jgi:hypothetical protein